MRRLAALVSAILVASSGGRPPRHPCRVEPVRSDPAADGHGSNWYFQGAPSPWWDDDDLGQLESVSGDWFEVVDTGPIRR